MDFSIFHCRKRIITQLSSTIINVFANFLGRLLSSIATLIAIPVIVNKLGNELFGIYSFINIIFIYLTVFDLGLSKGIVKFLSDSISNKQYIRQKEIVYTVLFIYSLMGFLFLISIFTFSEILISNFFHTQTTIDMNNLKTCFYIMSFSIFMLIIRSVFTGILVANHNFVLLNVINTFSEGIKWGLIIIAVYLGYSLISIFFIQFFSAFAQTAISCFFAIKLIPKKKLTSFINIKISKEIITYSWPIAVSDLISKFIVHIDKIIFAYFYPVASLTYYVVSFQLASKVWEIPSNILSVYFPKFSQEMISFGRQHVVDQYYQVTRIITFVTLPILLVLALWGKVILGFWINTEVAEVASGLLAIFAIGVFLGSIALPSIYLSNALGWIKIPLKTHSIMALVNIVLCIILIPKFGLIGAALSWTTSHILELLLMIPLLNKKMKIHTIHYLNTTIFKPFLVTGSLILVIYYIVAYLSSASFLSFIYGLTTFTLFYLIITYNFLCNEQEKFLIKKITGTVWRR